MITHKGPQYQGGLREFRQQFGALQPSYDQMILTTMKAKAPSCPREPAIREVMLPRDTNPLGSIFGGHILSLLDLAAGQHARQVSPRNYVTKVMREVEFIAPVRVGDSVSFYTSTKKIGRTSITIQVDVEATRGLAPTRTMPVTSAEVVMVAVNAKGRPIAVRGK